jgi:hypothetical protein
MIGRRIGTQMSMKLKSLAESLKSLTKYPDRPLIDYWRTVQGTPVGFHGDPKKGAGIPIAGPPVLTGGATSGNPLLEPLLKKYPKKTFIGDAIRKKNFPLSTINFIENFVGGDEKAIKARFAAMEERISDSVRDRVASHLMSDMAYTLMNKFPTEKKITNAGVLSGWQNPIQFHKELGFSAKYDFTGNKDVAEYVEKLNKEWPAGKADILKKVQDTKFVLGESKRLNIYVYPKEIMSDTRYRVDASENSHPHSILTGHFISPASRPSLLYKIMQIEGVAGTFTGAEGFLSVLISDLNTKEAMNTYLVKIQNTDYEKCREYLGDLYVLNQIMMKRNGKTRQKVARGMGNSLSGLGSEYDSMKVVAELKKNNVPMRFVNRPISGFASGGTSEFVGWTVSTEVPAEAILSSTFGAKAQDNSYPNEREALIIGAASLAFEPDQITYARKSSSKGRFVITADRIMRAVDEGKTSVPYY